MCAAIPIHSMALPTLSFMPLTCFTGMTAIIIYPERWYLLMGFFWRESTMTPI